MKNRRFLLLLSLLLIRQNVLICMDTAINKQKMLNLTLDDGSLYSIAKWKVKKESNTLCECYYVQHTYFEHTYGKHKNNPIIVHNISREELTLFDLALDKRIDNKQPDSFFEFFNNLSQNQQRMLVIAAGERLADGTTKKLHAQRLTSQLVGCYFDEHLIFKNIIGICSELAPLIMNLKILLLSNNLQSGCITPSSISSYSMNPGEHLRKFSKNGAFIVMPNVKGLNNDFNGQPSKWAIMDEAKEKYAVCLVSPVKKHFVTNTKFINDMIDVTKLLIWQDNPRKLIKTINHNARIERASFSPDGKWLITSSYGTVGRPQSKLLLTCLDDSSVDCYLADTSVVSKWNFNHAPCFNNASTLVISGKPGTVELFSLATKKIFSTLNVPCGGTKPWPLELAFNNDDTRLVGCFDHGREENKHTIMIWNSSNLDDIKELQAIEIPTKRSSDATITFNYPEQNTIVVSTDYTTFFFDAHSGAFLGRTASEEEQENYTYAAACSIKHSRITCIAKNKGNTSSCVNLYNHRSGDCIGSIPFTAPVINGIGVTSNGRFLVTTFDKYTTITTELMNETQHASTVELVKNMKLVDFYALLQLQKAKKHRLLQLQKAKKHSRKAYISAPLCEYIKNIYAANKIVQPIIAKMCF